MIDRQALLKDLTALLKRLENDLLLRSESADVPEVRKRLQVDFNEATKRGRTALNYEDWRSDFIAQIAVAWVLSCVFARFLEDNGLVAPPRISGPDRALQQARDEHESYFRAHPRLTDREYLLDVFAKLAALPGAGEVFGPHNPIHQLPNWLSGDAAGLLLEFFQKIDPASGALIHDFTDAAWDTRFLGDLYQDLSEATRKKYALLQTPHFVEAFILDRTLEPALETFGLEAAPVLDGAGAVALPGCFRMIDPACGSGHFLLGAFARILDRWQRQEPSISVRTLVQRTLDSIYGVDLNPYAVAIARFRLLLVALHASEVKKLKDAPNFKLNLACGDSLLHGEGGQRGLDFEGTSHTYASEDKAELSRILRLGAYHAVVANPPYITPKDKAANVAYRTRYESCHMKYPLAVPFMERIFRLAVAGGASADSEPGGFTGQITANSFMKREFGKKLIESFFPKVELTHVIDSQLAHVPGHGTPHVIVFGRNRPPVAGSIRLVGAIKREDTEPTDPAKGKVWTAITTQVDQPGSTSEFVSANDSPRAQFHKHPWSIGGGGAAELKEQLEESGESVLKKHVDSIGPSSFAGVDDMFFADDGTFLRLGIQRALFRSLILGDVVRDWVTLCDVSAMVPYNEKQELLPFDGNSAWGRYVWLTRTHSQGMVSFNQKTRQMLGEPWWSWYRWIPERYRTPLSIVFGEVATHNHFVLDRGGKVFKQTAPVIKLKPGAIEDDHLALLGILNSSTACFWMKQVCHCKGGGGIGGGIAAESWERFYAFNGTNLQKFPLSEGRPLARSQRLDALACQRQAQLPDTLTSRSAPTADTIATAEAEAARILSQMIALQEELDWECYRLYGLLEDDLTHPNPPGLQLGQRAIEIVLARKMASGEIETTWFIRHGSTPITELPADWPDDYKALVEKRIELIENDSNIRLIEQPEYKRRWNTEPWDEQLERALRHWLLYRLESYFDFDGRMNEQGKPTHLIDPRLISLAQLAEYAGSDPEFQQVGAIYRDDNAFNVSKLVAELVEAESVPLLPVLRYKDTGLRKRAEWERTWDLQRKEDAGEDVGTIPVPPKYSSADFKSGDYWRLRGKLDVPKERWISFPHCPDQDGTMTIAWAGLNHLQQANAIAAFFVDVQERQGGSEDPRLEPLLAALIELLPWLKQWHNEIDPKYQQRMGDYFEGFIATEARKLGKTPEQIKGWSPAKKVNTKPRRATKTKAETS